MPLYSSKNPEMQWIFNLSSSSSHSQKPKILLSPNSFFLILIYHSHFLKPINPHLHDTMRIIDFASEVSTFWSLNYLVWERGFGYCRPNPTNPISLYSSLSTILFYQNLILRAHICLIHTWSILDFIIQVKSQIICYGCCSNHNESV